MKFGESLRLGILLCLVFTYFLVESCVGYYIKSLSLIGDSFHMLSDFMAIIIGLIARKIGKYPKSKRMSYGWQRSEIVGALVNSVILFTLTVTLIIRCVQRFIEPEAVTEPIVLFWVGFGGLIINILGLVLLSVHGHSHGSIDNTNVDDNNKNEHDLKITVIKRSEKDEINEENMEVGIEKITNNNEKKKRILSANMKAVFFHVLADFLGSVVVCVNAGILWMFPIKNNSKWQLYIDPICSIILSTIIFASIMPMIRKYIMILLQGVPKDIDIDNLGDEILKIDGVKQYHDLHIWQLQGDVIIATVHIECDTEKASWIEISRNVKKLFHSNKIHCTTIQGEFDQHLYDDSSSESSNSSLTIQNSRNGKICLLDCEVNDKCTNAQGCCPQKTSVVDIEKSNNNDKPEFTNINLE